MTVIICVYEALAHRYMIIPLSILAFLDRYGIGTVPLHLSTSVNESLISYRSVPILDQYFVGLVPEQTVQAQFGPLSLLCRQVDRHQPVQVWTHAVPYRSKMDRYNLYRYGTAPDVYFNSASSSIQ